jgi:hypothetical protein
MAQSANPLKPPARVKIPRQEPHEQPAAARAAYVAEVSGGFDRALALVEAMRCLECRDPACTRGCPVGIDIRGFIQRLLVEDYAGAAARIRESNALPAICGRVCPQESQCEATCTIGRKFKPVAIGLLERFVADWENEQGPIVSPPRPPALGVRVAVVGSGPAGLTCAADLARLGYQVVPGDTAAQVAEVRVLRTVERPARGGGPVSVGVGGATGSYGSGLGAGVGIDLTPPPPEVASTEMSVVIRDSATGQSLWEGRAEFSASTNTPYASAQAAAQKMADALFAGFPGRSGETIEVK